MASWGYDFLVSDSCVFEKIDPHGERGSVVDAVNVAGRKTTVERMDAHHAAVSVFGVMLQCHDRCGHFGQPHAAHLVERKGMGLLTDHGMQTSFGKGDANALGKRNTGFGAVDGTECEEVDLLCRRGERESGGDRKEKAFHGWLKESGVA